MFFYNVVIHPIKQFLEICYLFFLEFTGSPGISVIALSFAVTLCCLPLYIVAEGWQNAERQKQKEMKPYLDLIKKNFKGDERYMITSAYYRISRYNPLMAARSSFGVLIQIPFFIAAYSFLSQLGSLKGIPFIFIKDLSSPDALISINSMQINVLPITMTAINYLSGAIYTHGNKNIREKIQIYGVALIFLALLYKSPAGLVLYWTMNNILSLVKNVFYKLKNPIKVLYISAATASAAGIICVVFGMKAQKMEIKALFVLFCAAIIVSPIFVKWAIYFIDNFLKRISNNKKSRLTVFILSAAALCALVGLVIPSILIESEVQEFCYIDKYKSPFIFLATAFFQSAGLFIFWPLCFYALFGERIKNIITFSFAILASYAIINTFIFAGEYGPMTRELDFMEGQLFKVTPQSFLLNLTILVILFFLASVAFNKKIKSLIPYYLALAAGLSTFSIKNVYTINNSYNKITAPEVKDSLTPIYSLSKTEKNVLVFMQDRLISPLIDECFEEKEGLADRFEGFTFYPNTVSLGELTMLGTPGIFGGYSFTPAEMNKRDTLTIQQKHNQALLSMPVNFHEAGFDVCVSDMPYENFLKEPVTDMYKSTPWIKRRATKGAYSDYWHKSHGIEKSTYTSDCLKRNFLMLGIFKSAPPFLRRLVYHDVWWNSRGEDPFDYFIDSYACLEYLPKLFDATSEKNSFIAIDNLSTHDSITLKTPEYIPTRETTEQSKWANANRAIFDSQVATIMRYADFFDWLKENDIYDNTRIIIVSDHGAPVNSGKFKNESIPIPIEHVTASLLVKDFYDRSPSPDGIHLKKDMTFMTNADTPAIATRGIIESAKNPFTQAPYDVGKEKNSFIKIAYAPAQSTRWRDETKLFIPNNAWYTVHEDIFKAENWKRIYPFGE